MKKILLIALISIISVFGYSLVQKTLDNGMEIIVKENNNTNLVGLYCFVKTGSVHEDDYLGSGLSHYLEHIVSGGTTDFHTEEEYKNMQKETGALVNAFTTSFTTAYHITVDKEFQNKSLKILAENLMSCKISKNEFEREKGVILKEIVMRSTPPRAKYHQKFQETFFQDANNRYPVIGYTNLFKKVSRDQLFDYYKKRYVPNNMIFVAVGNCDENELSSLIEEEFSKYERKKLVPVFLPKEAPKTLDYEVMKEFRIELPQISIKQIVSDIEDVNALNMALSIIFGNRNARLNKKFVEEDELVNWIYAQSSIMPSTKQGYYQIGYEAKELKDSKKILGIIESEINKVISEGFTEKEMSSFIQREIQQIRMSQEKLNNEIMTLGISYLIYGDANYQEKMIEKYKQFSSEDLQAVLKKYLTKKNRLVFYGLPEGSKSFFEDKEIKTAVETFEKKIEVDKNISLILKKSGSDIIKGSFSISTGKYFEDKESAEFTDFLFTNIVKGSKKYPAEEMKIWLQENSVKLQTKVNNSNSLISFQCFKKDLDELIKRISSCIEDPEFSEKELNLYLERYDSYVKRQTNDPSTAHSDFRQETLYGKNQAAGISLQKQFENLKKIDSKKLNELYKKLFKNNGKSVICLSGNIEEKNAKNIAKKIYKAIPKGEIKEQKQITKIIAENKKYINKYEHEQVNIDINYNVPLKSHKDAPAISVLEAILTGSRGRLFNAARGENDLAYSIYAYYSSDEDFSFFRITTQTSIDKKEEILNVIDNEIQQIIEGNITKKDIESSVNDIIKTYQNYFKGLYLTQVYVKNEIMYDNYKYLEQKEKEMLNVSPEEVIEVAKKYFSEKTSIISEPNDSVKKLVD